MYLSSLVCCSTCFKMCICMVAKFKGLRFMSPWGGSRTWRSLPGPVWRAPLHSSPPPPPPWQPTFPGLSINFEGWGKGVAWPTLPLPPYYTDYSVAHFLPGFTCVRVVCQVSPNNVKYSFISYTHQPIPVWITFSIMYGEGSGDVQ